MSQLMRQTQIPFLTAIFYIITLKIWYLSTQFDAMHKIILMISLQPEVYDMIYSWRDVLDDWKNVHGGETRIMMTEAYANLTFTMRYYESVDGTRKGSHIPFNFLMISDLNENSSANDFVHTINKWMSYMPAKETANWVVRRKS